MKPDLRFLAVTGLILAAFLTGILWNRLDPEIRFRALNSQNQNAAKEVQNVFRQIAKDTLPKVVRVDVTIYQGIERTEKNARRTFGSGFFVEQDAGGVFLLTNHHVIKEASEIRIVTQDKTEYTGTLIGSDERSDLAVVKINMTSKTSCVKIGQSSQVQVGDWAIGIGNPFGFDGSVTIGAVSALGRPFAGRTEATDFIQTDAAINPGNSGGPLLNIDGEVIGINSWIASQTGSNTGLSFAIPIDHAMFIYQKLKQYSKVEYAWLGVYIKGVNDPQIRRYLDINLKEGALVTEVIKGSPADLAGIRLSDIILKIEDKVIHDANELIWIVSRYNPGDKIKVSFIREGKTQQTVVTLGKRPGKTEESPEKQKMDLTVIEFLGAEFSAIQAEDLKRLNPSTELGVIIRKIKPGTSAADFGLQADDIIVKINTSPVLNIKDLEAFIKKAQDDKMEFFYFTVLRNGRELLIGVQK
jgi:serine protease Do